MITVRVGREFLKPDIYYYRVVLKCYNNAVTFSMIVLQILKDCMYNTEEEKSQIRTV